MFYKPFYITFLFIAILLFSFQKSKGADFLNSKYKTIESISKTPKPLTPQSVKDFLLNIDDNDDETSTKVKYKILKTTINLSHKFNCSKQEMTYGKSGIFPLTFYTGKFYSNQLIHRKKSIIIIISCLRI